MGHEQFGLQLWEGPGLRDSAPKAWDSLPVPHGPEDPPASTNTLRKLLIGYTCRQCGVGVGVT